MLQMDGTAPYAPVKAVTAVIERHRQVSLPSITVDTLGRMGISDSLAPRTMQSLKLLELVNDAGDPTDEFEAIRIAPSDQYQAAVANLLRDVYAPVFQIVDPTTATVSQIEDAFRGFKPPGQRGRMVTLFTGLMAYAGMVSEAPKQTPGPRPKNSGASQAPRKPKVTPAPAKPMPPAQAWRQREDPDDDMRRMYFELLLEKAKTDTAETGLLDRIERLIGLPSTDSPPQQGAASSDAGGGAS